ncbi:MAG: beta-ketoacyl synthase N-terminal-like domain-containing protein [Pseudomonadota bacterium]
MSDIEKHMDQNAGENDIAIVGMAAHLPGAGSLEQYWSNLKGGVESIRRLSDEDLAAAGETPDRQHHRNYVPAAAVLDGFEQFDGDFFGFSPKESAIMDPQHRQFLEVAWEAFENAGHPPERFPGAIGVYAGCGMGSYFYFNVCSNPDLVDQVGMFLLRHTGNDKDFLSTRVSHVFDLKGPSVNMQTACSTSLVTTHYACQALLSGECDMALAGGVTIELPHGRGYVFEEGEILSPDGHCHAFDHRAQGTVFGSGAGIVVLRRLADAIADGDHIWAVVKGTAINNDGAAKAGYLAPSVDGQAGAVAEAHAIAGITADTIDYVECHGTGTYLGDPIEVAALTAAFAETTEDTGFCRIGSVKTNIGHLDTAAGAASLIKTALSLHNRQLPPSLGYEAPNPAIDFETSPFRVNDALCDWIPHKGPRRAGVNSLGVGGTNAHVILEEAPERAPSEDSDWPFQVLTVSGRNRAALDANTAVLAAHLRANPGQPLADVAFTLKQGRRAFEKRRVVVAETHEEAAGLLEQMEPRRVFSHAALDKPEMVFMFPGGGAQFAGMARDLYDTEPVFQDWMDRGLDVLEPRLDYDIRALWLPEEGAEAEADEILKKPSVQLPLIMIVEYALARLWMSWGVEPDALVGHSMGENTAACLAGVMSFEDCIGLVHLRGQLFDTVPAGGMLSVPMAEGDLRTRLGDHLDMASVNAPELCVASGPQAALDALEAQLKAEDIEAQRVPIDIAAHSRMLEPILQRFGDYLRSIALHAPKIPIVSNRTGAMMTAAQATDPDYWVQHLRNTVHFADCITTLSAEPNRVYLEVGPGKALSSLTQMHGQVPSQQILSSLRHPKEDIADDAYFLGVIGRLWALGAEVDWESVWGEARRNRVVLPSYAFQRAPYFIEPGKAAIETAPSRLMRTDVLADWGWRPVWRQRLAECEIDIETELGLAEPQTWLIFVDDAGLGQRVVDRLRGAGQTVVEVHPGDAFGRTGEQSYVLAPERGRDGYDELIRDLVSHGTAPSRIAHFWLVTRDESFRPGSSFFHRNLERGFYSLMFLAQAMADEGLPTPLHVTAVTSGAAEVRGEALPYPEKSTLMGPVRVIPREMPGITCAALDVALPQAREQLFGGRVRAAIADPFAGRRQVTDALDRLTDRVLEDLMAAPRDHVAALRGEKRYELDFRAVALDQPAAEMSVAGTSVTAVTGTSAAGTATTDTTLAGTTLADTTPAGTTAGQGIPVRRDGVWLITGGFGGIGLTVAEELVRTSGARIVLLARSALPPRERWATHLAGHGPQDTISRRIRAVERLEALGGRVLTAAADVCNVEEMRQAIDAADAAFGPVTGLIHAAGTVDDGPLMAKTPASVEDVFTPKIHGLQVLDTLFPDGALETMVLFSSTSTVTAPAGQVDYVAANEYLNAYARSRAGGRTRVVSINWGIWNEVGMAAEAVAERTGDRPEASVTPATAPLLDHATFDETGNRVFVTAMSTGTHWVLDGHRTLAGDALLPGTGYLDIAAQALREQGEQGPFEIRDVFFLRPLAVADGATDEMRVHLRRSDEGYALEIRSACTVDGRPAFALNAQATLALAPMAVPAPLDVAAIEARCAGRRVPEGAQEDPSGIRSPQEEHLTFGPRWRVLRTMSYGTGEGIARLALPAAFHGDLEEGYLLHPALLDLATGWAMELIAGYQPDTLWVPVSYGAVRVFRALPAEIRSWVRGGADRPDAPFATFDVTLTDADGQVCAEIEGFSIRRLEGAVSFTRAAPPAARDVVFADANDAVRPLSPAEERLAHNLSQGILPAEGGAAFLRALGTGLPQVVVSSLDLPALVRQTAATGAVEETGGQKFQRPELDSAYVEPSTDIERTLVGFWEELLGIDQVGVADSFFDLGGHSLIAVRLFAKIKKTYQVDLPISVLFEAPTIARCAGLIAERVGGDTAGGADTGGDAGGSPAASRPARRFTHLVAMHEGEGGPMTPVFLVAGMFGNVLNLRHLAHLIGTDRPFYGLQARGLYGGEAPHTSLVEAATDYIAEMRAVRPHGPFILGGFSGGGITAYEIARQLRAAGEDVPLLILLDTPLPVRPSLNRRDKAMIKMQLIREQGAGYLGDWVQSRIRWELGKLRRRFEETEAVSEHQFHDADIEAAFLTAVRQYRLARYEGPVTLFRPPLDRRFAVSGGKCVSEAREYVFEDNQWSAWIADLDVIEVPGDHDSMVLEPNVRVLAKRLRAAVRAAETGRAVRGSERPALAAE